MPRADRASLWTTLAMSLAGVVWFRAGVLEQGGLALVAIALVGGIAIGVPLAAVQRRRPLPPHLARALRTVMAIVALSTAALPWMAVAPLLTLATLALTWALAFPLATRRGMAGAAIVAVGVGALSVATLSSGRTTLIDPVYTWSTTVPAALAVGMWWSGAATEPRTPWLSLGFGALAAVWITLWAGWLWPTETPLAASAPLLFAVPAVFASQVEQAADEGPGWERRLLACLGTVALVGLGAGAVNWLWIALVPALFGFAALWAAMSAGSLRARALLSIPGVVALSLAIWAMPAAPETVGGAITVGSFIVAAIWIVGMHAVREVPT